MEGSHAFSFNALCKFLFPFKLQLNYYLFCKAFSDPNPALFVVASALSLNLLGSFIMIMMTLHCSGLGWIYLLTWLVSPFSSVQSLSRVWLFATPWITTRQASLSITISRSSLKLMSIDSVMPSSHLILCHPLPPPAPNPSPLSKAIYSM